MGYGRIDTFPVTWARRTDAGPTGSLRTGKTVRDASDAFLARSMAVTTRRSYTQTLSRLVAAHGTVDLSTLEGATLDAFTTAAWGQCAPAIWNRHIAALSVPSPPSPG